MKSKIAFYLFVAVSVPEMVSHLTGNSFLHHLAKPLIMPALGLYYFLSTEKGSREKMVFAAILFSFLGDSFLMYDSVNELYFMLGLGSFLLAHVFYAITYGHHTFHSADNALYNIRIIRMALPIIIAGTGLVVILYPVLGELRLPVIVYALVLIVMVLKALFRYRRTSAASFLLVVMGAILFMISDSVLAINKFLQPVEGSAYIIMGTYIVAQLLIIEGLIKHGKATVPAYEDD